MCAGWQMTTQRAHDLLQEETRPRLGDSQARTRSSVNYTAHSHHSQAMRDDDSDWEILSETERGSSPSLGDDSGGSGFVSVGAASRSSERSFIDVAQEATGSLLASTVASPSPSPTLASPSPSPTLALPTPCPEPDPSTDTPHEPTTTGSPQPPAATPAPRPAAEPVKQHTPSQNHFQVTALDEAEDLGPWGGYLASCAKVYADPPRPTGLDDRLPPAHRSAATTATSSSAGPSCAPAPAISSWPSTIASKPSLSRSIFADHAYAARGINLETPVSVFLGPSHMSTLVLNSAMKPGHLHAPHDGNAHDDPAGSTDHIRYPITHRYAGNPPSSGARLPHRHRHPQPPPSTPSAAVPVLEAAAHIAAVAQARRSAIASTVDDPTLWPSAAPNHTFWSSSAAPDFPSAFAVAAGMPVPLPGLVRAAILDESLVKVVQDMWSDSLRNALDLTPEAPTPEAAEALALVLFPEGEVAAFIPDLTPEVARELWTGQLRALRFGRGEASTESAEVHMADGQADDGTGQVRGFRGILEDPASTNTSTNPAPTGDPPSHQTSTGLSETTPSLQPPNDPASPFVAVPTPTLAATEVDSDMPTSSSRSFPTAYHYCSLRQRWLPPGPPALTSGSSGSNEGPTSAVRGGRWYPCPSCPCPSCPCPTCASAPPTSTSGQNTPTNPFLNTASAPQGVPGNATDGHTDASRSTVFTRSSCAFGRDDSDDESYDESCDLSPDMWRAYVERMARMARYGGVGGE